MGFRTRRPRGAASESLECRVLLSAELVKDIGELGIGSGPDGFTEFRGALYFSAAGPQGREVYRSDGPAGGAALLKDLAPGSAGSDPSDFAVLGDALYFAADAQDGAGRELWKTDGTAAGTVRVADIYPGPDGSGPFRLTAFNGALYFAATVPERGRVLYKSDGTGAGTAYVFDPAPLVQQGGPREMAVAGNRLYVASQGTMESLGNDVGKLFVTDGTTEGTVQLKTYQLFGGVQDLTPLGDGVIFSGWNPATQLMEPSVSDGTPQGTLSLAPISSQRLARAGDRVYFISGVNVLYKTDGTPEGTVPIKQLNTGGGLTYTHRPVALGGQVLFGIYDNTGPALWRSDGTADGTVLLRSGPVVDPVASGGAVYFGGAGDLWKSDGTEGGTVLVKVAASPTLLRPFHDGVAFRGVDTPHADEPWVSDGTADGTVMLADVNPRNNGSVGLLTATVAPAVINGRALFPASTGVGPTDLWATDGTAQQAERLADLAWVGGIRRLGEGVLALADEQPGAPPGAVGSLWRTRGTAATTERVADLRYEAASQGAVESLTEWDGALYFSGDTAPLAGRLGWELFRTDGTAAGTYRVADIRAGSLSSSPREITAAGGRLFFTANGTTTGNELWTSDGTAAGTVLVKRFPRAAGSSSLARNLVELNGTLLFRATGPANQVQLWRSDGTEQGTVLVKELAPDRVPPQAQAVVRAGGFVYFTAAPAEDPFDAELWKSDGTAAGTVRVKDINPVPGLPSTPQNLLAVGGRVYFSAFTGEWGQELWVSDGTEGGTALVADVDPGTASSNPVPWAGIDGGLYFAASDGAHGQELWVTDGTAGGSSMVEDVWAGAGASGPRWPVGVGERVVFFADDGLHGREPWAAPRGTAPAAVVGRHVFYNRSSFDGNDPAANAADDGAVATDKAALLPGRAASFANVTSYGRGINGIMIDVSGGLPPTALAMIAASIGLRAGPGGDPGGWAPAPGPAEVGIRPGAGVSGSDRVTLVWPDGAIRNTWLQVTVPALPQLGLPGSDVFYVGNLVGEVGNGVASLAVNSLDLLAVRRHFFSTSPVTGRFDFDRDGRVTATDFSLARGNFSGGLALLAAGPSAGAVAPADRVAESVLK